MRSTSSAVVSLGTFTVLLIEWSMCFWIAACIFTRISALIWCAVTKYGGRSPSLSTS